SAQVTVEELIKHVENETRGTKFEKQWNQYLPRMLEVFESSMKGFLGLGLPGTVVNTTRAAISERMNTLARLQREEAGLPEAQEQRADFEQEVKRTLEEKRQLIVQMARQRGIETTEFEGFSTGQEIEFDYMRKTEAPVGEMAVDNASISMTEGWETGTVKFETPLVIPAKQWKAVLSQAYEGKTGQELTNAIVADGYDAIVTVDVAVGQAVATREIVQLPKAEPRQTEDRVEAERAAFEVEKKDFEAKAGVMNEMGQLFEKHFAEDKYA
ncbi:unnamed protein product, partial [marine sediment metagenome]